MNDAGMNPADLDDLEWFEDGLSQIEENPFDVVRIAAGIDHLTIYTGLGEHVGGSDYEGVRETYR